uniref:RHD_dimer domain-containing protein n=1 Tax=Gongylonema pulchrum TaxID=637853 RepID=A0A183DJL6_9BILA
LPVDYASIDGRAEAADYQLLDISTHNVTTKVPDQHQQPKYPQRESFNHVGGYGTFVSQTEPGYGSRIPLQQHRWIFKRRARRILSGQM